ncbi:MAG TPA: Spy/CpxP family protein refolding chaperone [Polyangia bacterium]|nr:Spy/CpxP family protein refolding chaperone [Polyangia bacterium]
MDTTNTNTSSAVTNAHPPRRWPRRIFGGLAVLVVGGALSISVAQAHGGPEGGPMGFHMHKILDKVGATDAQKAQIKTIWEGLRPQLKALHEQHEQLHTQITQAITAATIDTGAIEKLRQQSVQVIDKTSATITKGFVESAQVLTPDQRKQAAAEIEKAKDHHHEHFEEGGMGGE